MQLGSIATAYMNRYSLNLSSQNFLLLVGFKKAGKVKENGVHSISEFYMDGKIVNILCDKP